MKAQNVPRAQDGPKRVSILILRDLLVAPRPLFDPSWATLGFSRGGGPRGHLEAECGLGSEWLGHDMRQEAKMPQTSRACIKHTVFSKLLEARSRKTACELVLWRSFCGFEVSKGLTWTP